MHHSSLPLLISKQSTEITSKPFRYFLSSWVLVLPSYFWPTYLSSISHTLLGMGVSWILNKCCVQLHLHFAIASFRLYMFCYYLLFLYLAYDHFNLYCAV